MLKEKWNSDWNFVKISDASIAHAVSSESSMGVEITLPHDAMILEPRTQETKNMHQTGFYPGGNYSYKKKFYVPEGWRNQLHMLEFEGVYQNARVFINGDFVGGCNNGYKQFYIEMNDFLKFDCENQIEVMVSNGMEENSRWYSGSGIYRDVNLLTGESVYLRENSLRILTPEVEKEVATVALNLTLDNFLTQSEKVIVTIEILDTLNQLIKKVELPVTLFARQTMPISQRISIVNPKLWDCDHPYLYNCRITIFNEEKTYEVYEEHFGIRTLTLTAETGLLLNGKAINLRGACIHHDNGIIGAVTLPRSEERRCQQLKAAGFNAIRSSHHPMSKAMLNACDQEGMLVLDELADSWTRSKNAYDYANQFDQNWESDIEAMVAKDFNHPSVIMYISGNEIQEASSAKGAQLNRLITEKFHKLDNSRYVTVAINGLLASMDRMGEIMAGIMGISLEELADMQSQKEEVPKSDSGSDAANGMTDIMKGPLADAFATSTIVSNLLEEFASVTDLVGYNYLTARHEMEHELYPNRVILGTETFPSDIARLWEIVERNPHVIGDMTWTGYDYLGEAGSGSFYYDGRQGFMPNWPISLAEMGDIDIIGYRRNISYYREIVFGLRKKPFIAVERIDRYGQKPNQSAWPFKDELASWTWHGYENRPAIINVYAQADEIELIQDGVSLGRKTVGCEEKYCTKFETIYQNGKIEAIAYVDGEVIGHDKLETADQDTQLFVQSDTEFLKANGEDVAYIHLQLVDSQGRPNIQAIENVEVAVSGQGYLQGFGSADPATKNSYQNTSWQTYQGQLLAVVRSGFETGEITITFTSENCKPVEVKLEVK